MKNMERVNIYEVFKERGNKEFTDTLDQLQLGNNNETTDSVRNAKIVMISTLLAKEDVGIENNEAFESRKRAYIIWGNYYIKGIEKTREEIEGGLIETIICKSAKLLEMENMQIGSSMTKEEFSKLEIILDILRERVSNSKI